jgi:large conductance mechanosensitive channel
MNKFNERLKNGKEEAPAATEVELLTEIRDLLAREAAGRQATVPAPTDHGGAKSFR